MAKHLTEEELNEARKHVEEAIESVKGGLPPEWQRLADLIYFVGSNEEARETLQQEIVKHYGE